MIARNNSTSRILDYKRLVWRKRKIDLVTVDLAVILDQFELLQVFGC